MRRVWRIGVVVLALWTAVVSAATLAAQDADTSASQTETAEGSQQSDYDALFAQWKSLLDRMRELRDEYSTAAAEERPALEEEYSQQVAQAEKLVSSLLKAATAKFVSLEDKSSDEELLKLLDSHVRMVVKGEQYDEALSLGRTLIENGYPNAAIYKHTGIAAFNANEPLLASQYFGEASAKKVLLTSEEKNMASESQRRAAEAEADDLPRVKLTTSKGDVVIELFENEAPNTVANFISLVEKGFYDGLTFHRVLENFMAQGGCPKGDGTGGPGYRIKCECYAPNHRNHFRGSLSMAHAGRDTGGSQFFITYVSTSHLDGVHTVFGRVIEGMENVDAIPLRDPSQPNPPEAGKILKAEVLRKRDHDYVPETLPEQ